MWAEQDSQLKSAQETVLKLKIQTAVLTWGSNKKYNEFFEKCTKIYSDPIGIMYIFNNKVLIYLLGIGAPIAVGAVEQTRIMGIKNYIAVGTAGGIGADFDETKILVVKEAIRDEGSSYHYAPANKITAKANIELTSKLINFFKSKGLESVEGTTWTTDAFFRETKKRIAKRILQGAVSVEMESSAIAAACEFYKLKFCQFLHFADVVKQDNWTRQGTSQSRQDRKLEMLKLAIEFAQTVNL
ncbi:MAG: nucleoside phosphorylase [Firmicutes bacterium]|nr:nucleoside phosphorylase [Bacillota bacterium]